MKGLIFRSFLRCRAVLAAISALDGDDTRRSQTSVPSQVGCKNLASIDLPKVRDSGAVRSPLCCFSACSGLFGPCGTRCAWGHVIVTQTPGP